MISTVLLIALKGQTSITGLPSNGDIVLIGKLRPNRYAAMRDCRSLPKIKQLKEAKRKTFTGKVIVLDFPHPGSMHVTEFRNGKRSLLDNAKQKTSDNGVPLAKVLAELSPKADVRFGGVDASGFEVKLPGDEKKLVGFQGTLLSMGSKDGLRPMSILIRNGKIISSEWSR